MLRSGPGWMTGFSPTSTVPSVGGKCGRRPAISRSTVDLPQPDGPRIAMNSPLPGRSVTENVTSRMTVRSPNRFVTPWKSTTFGRRAVSDVVSSTSVLEDAVREQTALEPEQQPIDAVRKQADDDQDQDDVLGETAPLAGHQQVAEAVLRVDEFGEHDVPERETKEMPQAVEDVRQREADEHFRD